MRLICLVAGLVLLGSAAGGYAETRIPCSQSITHALQSRAVLSIESSPAGLQIVGTDEDAIRVSCTAGSDAIAEAVALHFSPTANGGKLSIEHKQSTHGNNNLEVKIEVPRRVSLSVRMVAGQVTVQEVKGDKDLQLGAGQITISPIHEGDYRDVDASVSVGEVEARAFGTDQGGFFRSFHKKFPNGDYGLRAHVTTGQIQLLGNAANGTKPD